MHARKVQHRVAMPLQEEAQVATDRAAEAVAEVKETRVALEAKVEALERAAAEEVAANDKAMAGFWKSTGVYVVAADGARCMISLYTRHSA